ncbi:hypothetical protein TIFTF001_028406 [Ficus carica]|uniref:Uncharacterized protein n=1 Tax=Ficus carica TaxID=3494 RepID=A0AA88DQC4_FICCA|nr:hypothetical protein TIFTF001_028406 [Ficus carica]
MIRTLGESIRPDEKRKVLSRRGNILPRELSRLLRPATVLTDQKKCSGYPTIQTSLTASPGHALYPFNHVPGVKARVPRVPYPGELLRGLHPTTPATAYPIASHAGLGAHGISPLGQRPYKPTAYLPTGHPRQPTRLGRPSAPNQREAPINRGRTPKFRIGHFFLVKTLPLPLLISTPADLSIEVPTADTTPVSPSFRGASFLQVIDGRATGQSRQDYPTTLGVAGGDVFSINNYVFVTMDSYRTKL